MESYTLEIKPVLKWEVSLDAFGDRIHTATNGKYNFWIDKGYHGYGLIYLVNHEISVFKTLEKAKAVAELMNGA